MFNSMSTLSFEEANKKIHAVEKEWHYKILSKYGFVPEKTSAVGFVRKYIYNHPQGYKIMACVGANADHWQNMKTDAFGYWGTLESHVIKLFHQKIENKA